jgi:hypothetical protein
MKKCLLSLIAVGVLFVTSGTTWAEQVADSKSQADAGRPKPAESDRTGKVKMKYLNSLFIQRPGMIRGRKPTTPPHFTSGCSNRSERPRRQTTRRSD